MTAKLDYIQALNAETVSLSAFYPSHYGEGWLGFDDPNDHNAEVTADALDDGAPRLADGTLMRPWLQAFYYNASEVLEGIYEAEERGFGWLLWNANGNFELSWLPTDEKVAEIRAERLAELFGDDA